MKKNKEMLLDEDELEIIRFYRQLPDLKKKKFLKFLISLRKILLDDKEVLS